MPVTYRKELRDKAKEWNCGLVTIGWQDADGRIYTMQSMAGPATLRFVKKAMGQAEIELSMDFPTREAGND